MSIDAVDAGDAGDAGGPIAAVRTCTTPATLLLPKDYTLYRLGLLSGAHPNSIEQLARSVIYSSFIESALERELHPAIAHFLVAAAYTSEDCLRALLGPKVFDAEGLAVTATEKLEATFVRIETRRLLSITGGFTGQGRTVPCVVALFKSAAIAARRAEIHAAMCEAGIPILELFADGNTYPDGHVYVLLNTCEDEASSLKIAAEYGSDVALCSTIQVTSNFLSAVTPHGLCCGL